MFINFRLFFVENEAVSEHLSEISQELSDTGVLVRVLLVQALLDAVQGDGLLDLLQVGGEVQVGAVTEGNGLRPHMIHLEQKSSTHL